MGWKEVIMGGWRQVRIFFMLGCGGQNGFLKQIRMLILVMFSSTWESFCEI
jgi:hypothetical protein